MFLQILLDKTAEWPLVNLSLLSPTSFLKFAKISFCKHVLLSVTQITTHILNVAIVRHIQISTYIQETISSDVEPIKIATLFGLAWHWELPLFYPYELCLFKLFVCKFRHQ